MKKEYISPEFLFVGVLLPDVLSSSPEYYDDGGSDDNDWGDDPIFDDDDGALDFDEDMGD